MNKLDMSVINFIHNHLHKNYTIDEILKFFTNSIFFQGGFLIMVFYWLWFLPEEKGKKDRRIIIMIALFSSFVAIFFGRVIVNLLPFRIRPLRDPSLALDFALDSQSNYVDNLSSFPSDHAVLFFSMAAGLYFVSKKAGILAFIYSTLITNLTRVYFYYHYLTDVIAGAIIGISITYLLCHSSWMKKMAEKVYPYCEQKPQYFYPVFFLITYQLASLFGDIRETLTFLRRIL